MGDNDNPATPIGSTLNNDDTEKKLEFIEKLHARGVSRYVDLPQLVVVGDQSCGKSSVLQAITQLPFPVDDKMCTRFATEVALHRNATTSVTACIKRAETQLTEELEGSAELAGLAPESEEFADAFKRLIRTATEQILGSGIDTHILSKDILQFNVKGPKEINLTIVDIPGLVSVSHPAHATARTLVQRYIDNPKSIILAVAHPADPGTQEVFQMLDTIPDKENRVIGVITKCDRKQEGAETWILDTIKNDRRDDNPHYLTQGWFGLRNRLPIEVNTTNAERDAAEAAFFQGRVWPDLNRPGKLGIGPLRLALTKMHNNHITKTIPELVPAINQRLDATKSKLAHLGRSRSTQSEQLDCMVTLASSFSKLATDALDGQYHNLPDEQDAKLRKHVHSVLESFRTGMQEDYGTSLPQVGPDLIASLDQETWRDSILEEDILHEILETILDNRGREFPDEVNSNVMRVLWKNKNTEWRARAEEANQKIRAHIIRAVKVLIKKATVEDELRNQSEKWLLSCMSSTWDAASSELDQLIEDDAHMWTLVPQYNALMAHLYTDIFDQMVKNHVTLRNTAASTQLGDMDLFSQQQVKLWLANNTDINAVLIVYVRLRAYYEVAMARFIDNVGFQVVERHLLGPKSPLKVFTPSFVLKMAEDDPDLLKGIAGENEDKTAERNALIEEEATLRSALVDAMRYGLISG